MEISEVQDFIERYYGNSLDSSNLQELLKNYYESNNIPLANYRSIPFVNSDRLSSIFFVLYMVRSCFSKDEFSKLVCMCIVRYSHIHAIAFRPGSNFVNLSFERFATPTYPIPKNIESLEVTNAGHIRINGRIENFH